MLKKRDKDNEYINERFQRPGLTENEIEEIKYAFRLFDEKGHGTSKIQSSNINWSCFKTMF